MKKSEKIALIILVILILLVNLAKAQALTPVPEGLTMDVYLKILTLIIGTSLIVVLIKKIMK